VFGCQGEETSISKLKVLTAQNYYPQWPNPISKASAVFKTPRAPIGEAVEALRPEEIRPVDH